MIRIEVTRLADLKRIAEKHDRSVSYLIRQAIDQFVEKEIAYASEDSAPGRKSPRRKQPQE